MATGNISLRENDDEVSYYLDGDMTNPQSQPPPQQPWLLLWSLHRYILGFVYFCLMCYALYSMSQSFRRTSAPKKVSNIQSCIFAIKVLLFLLGLSRTLYMYLYMQFWYDTGTPWKIVENILSNLAYPCLTGGFGLMCLILYEASRLKARSSSKVLHNKIILIFIIVVHFVAVIFAVTAIELLDNFVLMLLLCHGFFVIWGILLTVTFIVFATTLSKAERKSSGVLAEMKEKESVSYGVTASYQNFSNQSTPRQTKSDKFIPAAAAPPPGPNAVLEDVDGGSISSHDGNGQPRCDENGRDNRVAIDSTDIKVDGHHSVEASGQKDSEDRVDRGGGTQSDREGGASDEVFYTATSPSSNTNNGSAAGSRFFRLRSMVVDRFSTNKSEQSKSRLAFRVKLTRKVLRIAKITAILSTTCVLLNTFVIIRALLSFYYGWKLTPTTVYVFNTFFRLIELGQGFTMAYFTTQSISKSSNTKQTFMNQAKIRKNTPFLSKARNIITTKSSTAAVKNGETGKD